MEQQPFEFGAFFTAILMAFTIATVVPSSLSPVVDSSGDASRHTIPASILIHF